MNKQSLSEKLFLYLQFEKDLLGQLVELTEMQQSALIKFNSNDLEKVTKMQDETACQLKKAEDQRLRLLMTVFNISKTEAVKMKLSEIADKLDNDNKAKALDMKDQMKALIEKLHSGNSANRLLAGRAMRGVSEILAAMNNGKNNALNVKV